MEFKLPDIGEGIHEGEIVKWRVKEGDSISENAPLVEVMTDKATVEIPSPTKGKIQKIHFKEGQTVQVDTVIVTIQEEGASPKKFSPSTVSPPIKGGEIRTTPSSPTVLAAPAVRQLAKELGVDLAKVKGSGPQGSVTLDDVKKGTTRFQPHPIPKLGPEERIPVRGVRKTIAHHLQMAKYYAPHFTHVEEADVTALVQHRNAKKADAEKKGIKLTYLSYIIKALIASLKEFPYLNASLDETSQEIVLKKYYHIGFATDTPDGLVVPVIKDADKKSVEDISEAIVRLADAVRNNKAKPEELKGSTFTVTSIGSIGGVLATPILNYPDVAILAINRFVERPVVLNGKIVPRHMTYLAMTLDHRVVDGAQAARFLNHLVETLQKPETIK